MRITLFGTGYTGLVTGACLASVGHNVICVDIDQQKIKRLQQAKLDIYEPGLATLVNENQAEKRLNFTDSAMLGVQHAEVIFIAVGTPAMSDGSADLSYVLGCAREIAEHLSDGTIIVNKSTVPVGTVDKIRETIQLRLTELGRENIDFDVCSNPEFLKEGAAVEDFRRPDRIVIGTNSERVKDKMTKLYSAFSRNHSKLMFMDSRSAELTKYAANAMLATKISFINEIANIAEQVGADIEDVRLGIGADERIGYHFIYAGSGYGGSCFPKDVKALSNIANQCGYDDHLLKAVDAVNERQKVHLLNHIDHHYQGDLSGKKIAVWGLSFKPQTNDVREASSAVVIQGLLERGAKVSAYDPHAIDAFHSAHSNTLSIEYDEDMMSVIADADALVICTEWRQFRSTDFDTIKAKLKAAVIFDGRNMYDPQDMQELGFEYYGIGRGLSIKKAP